jgi:glycosyltransferase involved in cell wall biosynthesis
MISLSIIIPVYNAEKYIERCIRSILIQIDNSIELIIVNDGSTDNSLEKIKTVTDGLQNVLIFSQINRGVSSARNKGIELAKGEYIFFIDADDYLIDQSLSQIISLIGKYNVDAIGFSIQINDKGFVRKICRGKELIIPMKGIEWAKLYSKELYYLHSFIFRKSSIVNMKLIFNPKISVWEDSLFLMKFFTSAQSVLYKDLFFYNYNLYPDSLSHKRVYRTPLNRFLVLVNLIYFFYSSPLNSLQRKYVKNRILFWAILFFDTMSRYVFSSIFQKWQKRLNYY